MRNIKLTLEYDGSHFFGFQVQPGKPTVQREIEKALSKLFNRKLKIAAASGRTDRGVHAEGQVVNFKVDSKLSEEKILKGLNAYLPDAVAVRRVDEVSESFHARYSAKKKLYRYEILNSMARSPLRQGKAFCFSYDLNITKMREAAKILKGKHDFKSFCTKDSSREDKMEKSLARKGQSRVGTIRTIKKLKIEREGDVLRFWIEADGFLYNMVRILVGTLLDVGRSKTSISEIKMILKAKSRVSAGRTVPAEGLYLESVSY